MTPSEFKSARQALGLSQPALAELLRLSPGGTIYRYEAGTRKIPGPVEVAIEALLDGWRPVGA